MPFKSPEQEIWMKINQPELYREWVRKYGHHTKFNDYKSKFKKRRGKNNLKRQRAK